MGVEDGSSDRGRRTSLRRSALAATLLGAFVALAVLVVDVSGVVRLIGLAVAAVQFVLAAYWLRMSRQGR